MTDYIAAARLTLELDCTQKECPRHEPALAALRKASVELHILQSLFNHEETQRFIDQMRAYLAGHGEKPK